MISDIIVSTDSKKIEKISKFYGAKVPFIRPKALSTNNSPEILSWKHAVQHYEKQYQKKIDIFISLPTTAPLVKSKSVKDALKLFIKKKQILIYYCQSLRQIISLNLTWFILTNII